MPSLAVLEKYGLTADALKGKLSIGREQLLPNDPRVKLYDLIRTRISSGRDWNLQTWKPIHVVDRVYDTPFQQMTPTLMQAISGKDSDSKDVLDLLRAYDLSKSEIFKEVDYPDAKSGVVGKKKTVDVPSLYFIVVPIAKAYLGMRHSKIVTDYNQDPFMDFAPAMSTANSRMQCEAVTSRIGRTMSTQMGYPETFSQFVFNYLHYGIGMQFPLEEWYTDIQEKADGTDEILKEGIRYQVPHRARTFWDLSYPVSTLNTDTGCRYGGYWKVAPYGDIRRNPNFWNIDKVSIGSTDWYTQNADFFNIMYGSANIKFPVNFNENVKDRENQLGQQLSFYGQDLDDKPCLVTTIFMKLVPKEYGLGDYEHPMWFRFVVASEYTVLYASGMTYSPIRVAAYDPDENRAETASFTLELIPFQDQVTNILSQFILSVRQNLANAVLVDTDGLSIGEKDGKSKWDIYFRDIGNKLLTAINFIPFSGRLWRKGQVNPGQIFHDFKFPQANTNELMGAIRMILDLLERVMTISSQEVGQAASHELRVDEVRNINASTGTRLAATKMPIARYFFYWKLQLYEALMEHGSAEFWAQIPFEATITPDMLAAMGLTWDQSKHPKTPMDPHVVVKATKEAIKGLSFLSSRAEDQRTNQGQVAAQMLAALAQVFTIPQVVQSVGRQIIPLFNEIFQLAGFPKDFRLDDHSDQPQMLTDAEAQQITQMIQQAAKAILDQVKGAIDPIAQVIKKDQQALGQLAQQQEMLHANVDHIEQIINHTHLTPNPPVPMPQPEAQQTNA